LFAILDTASFFFLLVILCAPPPLPFGCAGVPNIEKPHDEIAASALQGVNQYSAST
tara:strand:- start:173 stop:340 length:168 start_codon:yes stop_codon:yes gene_type:complete